MLVAQKKSLPKNIEKMKSLDEIITYLLNEEAMEMELDESLERNGKFPELFIKVDMCLKTLENEHRNTSLNN